MQRMILAGVALVLVFVIGLAIGQRTTRAQTPNHIFEVRIYTAGDGKLDAVVKRFRDPEVKLFEKYGMKAVFYSTISEPADRQNQFVYVLQHDSREAARASWAKFLADPEFRAAAQASDEGGRAVVKVESFFVNPTDFSPLK